MLGLPDAAGSLAPPWLAVRRLIQLLLVLLRCCCGHLLLGRYFGVPPDTRGRWLLSPIAIAGQPSCLSVGRRSVESVCVSVCRYAYSYAASISLQLACHARI